MLGAVGSNANFLGWVKNQKSQTRFRNGCKEFPAAFFTVRKTQIPKFQIEIPALPALMANTWEIYDLEDNSVVTLDPNDLYIYETSDLRYFVEFRGEVGSGSNICGFYQMKINLPTHGDYWSEVFRLVEFEDTDDWWRLTVSHSSDFDDVMYQAGHEQDFYFKAYFDQPEIVLNKKTIVNGQQTETTTLLNTKERTVLQIPNLIDSVIPAWNRLEKHDTIALNRLFTDETYNLQQVLFTSKELNDCFQIGTLSFEIGNNTFTQSANNLSLSRLGHDGIINDLT